MRTINNRTYSGIILGIAIRGKIGTDKIFRVRKGTGYIEGDKNDYYQDQYPYFVPTSINNVQSQPYRQQWIAAVHKWKTDLTTEQKTAYNIRANDGLRMSGFNLFMREAMKGKVAMYVDRGDPAAYDFEKGDLSAIGVYEIAGLGDIVPAGAKAVLLDVIIDAPNVGNYIRFRATGNSNEINITEVKAFQANVERSQLVIVSCDSIREFEYKASNVAWNTLNITCRGWWT